MDKSRKIKVRANYPVSDDVITLWGITFSSIDIDGEKCYIAEVGSDDADSLIDAGRAVKAK